MKTKHRFLTTLLMAIVMMAMSPMKMWADNVFFSCAINLYDLDKYVIASNICNQGTAYFYDADGKKQFNHYGEGGEFEFAAEEKVYGFSFAGWYKNGELVTTDMTFTDNVTPGGNICYVAHYVADADTDIPNNPSYVSLNADIGGNGEAYFELEGYPGGSVVLVETGTTVKAVATTTSTTEYGDWMYGHAYDSNGEKVDYDTEESSLEFEVVGETNLWACFSTVDEGEGGDEDETTYTALNVGGNTGLDILGSITYTFTPTETGYYNFAFSEYNTFNYDFYIDVKDADGQHYGHIDIASGMSTFTPLTAEQTYRVRVMAITTDESGCHGVTLTVTKCNAPTMTAMEGTSAEGTVEADNQIYRSFSLENVASLTIDTDADWALLKKNASNVYECIAISIVEGTSCTQPLAAGDYAVALSGTDWEEQAYSLTLAALPVLNLEDNYVDIPEDETVTLSFTPETTGWYRFHTEGNNDMELDDITLNGESVFSTAEGTYDVDDDNDNYNFDWSIPLTEGNTYLLKIYEYYGFSVEDCKIVVSYEDVEIYTREMTNEWGTLCLPYPITYDANNGNHKLYTLTAASESTLTFTEIANGTIIAGGTPLAIKAVGKKNAETGKYNISVAYQKIGMAGTAKSITLENGYSMKGTYTEMTDKTGIYFIAQNQFWYADDAITIPANRAFINVLKQPIMSGAKVLNIVVEDEADGIKAVKSEQLTVNNGKFIENGKVVVVKNGKKFNVNGQRVK